MKNIVKCVAIDDEPLALDVIAKFCQRAGGMELTVFTDAEEGLAYIHATSPDIVFLDIEMENMSGLAVAASITEGSCIIFTTAYLNYAIDGFNLDAVDYLHKPFSYERFLTAVGKARRRMGDIKATPAHPASIIVKQDYNNVTIPLDDILYIEAIERYSRIFRLSGECTISRLLLKNMEEMLPADSFMRIHRSYIVATRKIRSFNRQEVRLCDGSVIPVGRQYSQAITARMSDASLSY